MFVGALKVLAMPPLCLYLAVGLGCLLWRRRPRLARWLVGTGAALLVLLSVPAVAALLLIGLQGPVPAADVEAGDAQAIVVLGADSASPAPEFPGAGVGALTLERLRRAAALAKRTGLPVLVSGGPPRRGEAALADAMAAVLERELGVAVRWRERASGTTRQNAERTRALLGQAGIGKILLVTHAWHAPRARAAFERAGLATVTAGTGWRRLRAGELGSWVPSARGLRESAWACHEWLGRAWYALGGG